MQQADTITLTKAQFVALTCATAAQIAGAVGIPMVEELVAAVGHGLVTARAERLGVDGPCGDHAGLYEAIRATGWYPDEEEEPEPLNATG